MTTEEQEHEARGGEDWGTLPAEPCRYCGEAGGVQFLASEQPLDAQDSQVVRCIRCGRVWDVDGKSRH